jgi:hypothetical protein
MPPSPSREKKPPEELRLTLLRITVVEAKNLVLPEGHQIKPYVSVRVGNQLGQTRTAGGRWTGGINQPARAAAQGGPKGCAWHQSFDLVVRQSPRPADLEDVLTLRLLSYQLARKDLVLGKADLAVATLGDPFRAPDVGNLFGAPSSSAASHGGGAAAAKRSVRRGSLAHRCAQDFWVPLTTTGPQVSPHPRAVLVSLRGHSFYRRARLGRRWGLAMQDSLWQYLRGTVDLARERAHLPTCRCRFLTVDPLYSPRGGARVVHRRRSSTRAR